MRSWSMVSLLPLLPLHLGCGCRAPNAADGTSESDGESTLAVDDDTDDEGTDPEPDLPPAPDCYPWHRADSFDQLCFGPPVVIDPTPTSFVRPMFDGYYVAGPFSHRLYRSEDLEPGGDFRELPLTGTTIELLSIGYVTPSSAWFVIVTRDPNALVVLVGDVDDQVILDQLELDAAPLAAVFVQDPSGETIVVSDELGNLELFGVDPESESLLAMGSRALPEPVTQLGQDYDEFGLARRVLGLSTLSSTLVRVASPFDTGAMHTWSLPVEVSAWSPIFVADVFVTQPLLLGRDPSIAVVYQSFLGTELSPIVALDHPVAELERGRVPSTFVRGLYALSTEANRVTVLLESGIDSQGSDVYEFRANRWIDVATGTEDFVVLNNQSFLCASMQAGLTLVSPVE